MTNVEESDVAGPLLSGIVLLQVFFVLFFFAVWGAEQSQRLM